MALIDVNEEIFYEVLQCITPDDWVKKNVLPVLNKTPVSQQEFNNRLRAYLKKYEKIHIIADWPEDIAHFCNALVTSPLKSIGLERMSFTVDHALFAAKSAIPHNALEDAKSIRELVVS
jgi:hypothetical protein